MIKIKLSRILGEKRMTQADLSRKTGIRPNTINCMYHELTDNVKLSHLDIICQKLDCNIDDLIEFTPDNKK